MANPQPENGHIDIATTIVDKLCSYRLSGTEWQIVWVILRKTWGWLADTKNKAGPKKKMDKISLSQFEELTGMDRRRCHKLLKNLVEKKIIKKAIINKGDRIIITYGFQKNFDRWKKPLKKGAVTHNDTSKKSVTHNDTTPVSLLTPPLSPIMTPILSPIMTPTIETLKETIKETLQKKQENPPLPENFKMIDSVCETIAGFSKKRNFEPRVWVTRQLNLRKHPGAILEALNMLSQKWSIIESPYGYARKIMKIQDGNYNEAEAIKIHEEMKELDPGKLKSLTKGLLGEI